MTELLQNVLKELEAAAKCSTDDLGSICRYCATEKSVTAILDNCENPLNVIKNLLEIVLEGRADNDTTEPEIRRARLALRVLINFCNRSTKLKESATSEIIPLCRCIIRIEELRVESCAFLVAIVGKIHKESLLHKDYPALLTDLTNLWHEMEDKSWITAYFLAILETDFAFLSLAFRELSTESFSTVLEITEAILDFSETDKHLMVHPNNILYCVDFIDLLLYELGEGLFPNNSLAPQLLISSIDIIGNCALRPQDYGNELLIKPTAVRLIIDVLEAALDAQSTIEEKEMKESPRIKYPDRPEIPTPCRVPRVQGDSSLRVLSALLLPLDDIRGKVKCAAVRAIGNLCSISRTNQLAAGQHGGITAILRCTKKRLEDKPFIAQWAIASLRHMIISCPENQDIVVSIEQKPSGILDRDKLLKELGVELIKDEETGKMKIKRMS